MATTRHVDNKFPGASLSYTKATPSTFSPLNRILKDPTRRHKARMHHRVGDTTRPNPTLRFAKQTLTLDDMTEIQTTACGCSKRRRAAHTAVIRRRARLSPHALRPFVSCSTEASSSPPTHRHGRSCVKSGGVRHTATIGRTSRRIDGISSLVCLEMLRHVDCLVRHNRGNGRFRSHLGRFSWLI